MTSTRDEMVVIGGGLMRTGTFSLHVALERLLKGKCYHMKYVFETKGHMEFWTEAAAKDPTDDEWKDFLADYKAAVDFPPVAFYQRLMSVYPNAKVVLTVRDPKRWFTSVNTTIVSSFAGFKKFPFKYIPKFQRMMNMFDGVIGRIFGTNLDNLSDETFMIKRFEEHVAEVKAFVPADKLLIFEAKDGWEPLCNFLNVEVPDELYPHLNTADDFRARIKTMKMAFYAGSTTILLASVGIGYLLYSFLGKNDWFSNITSSIFKREL